MKTKLFALALALGAGSCASTALADDGRFYVGGFAGVNLGEEQSFSGANLAGAPRRIDAPQDDGALAGLVVGFVASEGEWGRLRFEAELASRKNDVEKLTLNGVQRRLIDGETQVTTQMVNVAYDTPRWGKLRGMIGAGVGAASFDYDIQYDVGGVPGAPAGAPIGPIINIPTSASGRLAYQAMIGGQYELSPSWELTAELRYLWGDDHKVERFNQTTGALDSVLDATYESSAVTIGARHRF